MHEAVNIWIIRIMGPFLTGNCRAQRIFLNRLDSRERNVQSSKLNNNAPECYC